MKTDGIFTTHHFNIKFQKYGVPIYFMATGDWHVGSTAHDGKKFIEYLEEAKRLGAFLVGTGDYIDLMSTSERFGYSQVQFHEQTRNSFDKFVVARVTELSKVIKKYFGNRIIGLGGGNHYYTLSYGLTSDELLCQMLECKYLGVNSLTRVIFDYDKSSNSSLKADICIHHGLSGGRTPGTSINKLNEMANNFDADIFLQGHDHNRVIDYKNRLGLSANGKFVNRRLLLARTGTFLKTYEVNKPSYGVDALYPPSDLGGVKISITPHRTHPFISKTKRQDMRWLETEATI
jgi:hypothetical protein